jgi:membrane protein YqaA with SNARE-associated domain
MGLAASRRAPAALVAVSFAESSFFPVPPDVMLAPMVLARPDRAYFYAALCTIASVFGGLLGYSIGVFLEPLAHQILALFGHPEGQQEFQAWFARYGLWIILIKGLTPIPYKLVTITSGLARFDLLTFIWASVVTRGARFFLTATLLKYFGPAIRAEVERRLALYAGVGAVALVGVVVALKVLG